MKLEEAYRFFVVVIVSMGKVSSGAKILAILPIPFREHQSLYQPLIENLHTHGHEITVMTTNPIFSTRGSLTFENITEIDLSFVYGLEFLEELKDADLEGSDMIKTIFNVMRKIYDAELKHPRVKELLQTKKNYFDLVLVDWSGSSSLMNIFAHQFNVPLVAITNGEAFPNVHEAFGNPNHPITFPSVFLPFSENLNLIQRVSSVLSSIWYRYYYYTEEITLQNEIIKDFLGEENAPDMWEIESSADLLLINAYEILNNIRPSVPTTVYLGGIHQKTETNSLPQPLSQFLDESSGVVYVNLNNLIQYDPERLEKLISTFEHLDLEVVWNINDEPINSTARIFQGFDLDQEFILDHPKIILHITDGGQRNVEDSIHHAVPVLGISYSSTLDHYLHQIEKFQSGLVSYIDSEYQNEIESKIEELITSKRYKANMMKLKSLVSDQPIANSVERACWWINYVIRNKGTKHLQNGNRLSWMSYFMVDVFLTLLVGFVSLIAAFAYIIYHIRRYSKSLPYEKVTRGSKAKVL